MDNKKPWTPRRVADSNSCNGVAAGGGGGVAIVKDGGGRFVRGGRGRGSSAAANYGRPRTESSCSTTRPSAFVDIKRPASSTKKTVGYRSADRHGNQVTAGESRQAEIGSASRPGGRKPSLNHLLNFTYGTRDAVSRGRGSASAAASAAFGANSLWTTRKHTYNKEQFLQANCQFVVREGGDYAVHSSDPDLLVEWEWIEELRIPGHEFPSCPICLYPPVAAKVTRCGHVYCWTCMLHYLALSDKTWRKCPICYEAVHKGDLKSVVSLETAFYRVGDLIRMQLMRRDRGSVISLPRAHWNALETSSCGCLALDAAAGDACYAKLLVASREQVLQVLRREQMELDAALVCGPDVELEPESCFVEDALEQLRVRREKLLHAVHGKDEEMQQYQQEATNLETEGKVVEYASAFSDTEEEKVSDSMGTVVQSDPIGSPNQQNQGRGKDTYYFYQAIDGQHIYMHSVNVAMLVREHGCLEKCPDVVTATIVERETVSMNDELRGRLRCLAHLPLTCQFELVELDFSAASDADSVVSRHTWLAFRDEIKKRTQRRSRRAREENRRERQLLHENDGGGAAALIPIRIPRLHLDSQRQFPACGSDGGGGSSSSVGGGSPSPTDEVTAGSNHPLSSSQPDQQSPSSSVSFAQMLRAGKAKCEVAAAGLKQQRRLGRSEDVDDERDSEAGSPVPAFRDSFSAALWAALDDPALGVRSGDDEADGDVRHRRCKKGGGKKATKRLLFSTSVVRGQ